MPALFQVVELLLDCATDQWPGADGRKSIMPKGSRGVLVDQNTLHPHVWIIEFVIAESGQSVLGETTGESFRVCGSAC